MKHAKYLNYLIRHKWFVFVAGLKTGAPIWRLIIHDWSKFLPSEWGPYAWYFYGSMRDNDRAKPQFDAAWLKHQHRNPHHWQHWVLLEDSGQTKCLRMPERLVREMVADWMGAGRAITGSWEVTAWYRKNRDVIQLHVVTRDQVEELILTVCGSLSTRGGK